MGYKYIKAIFFGYIIIIFFGAIGLSLPISIIGELSFIDALFTSASATCVTGLIVTSTSENFTFFGEAIILFLIQIGGIGYMTLVTLFFLFLKDDLQIEEKRAMKEALDMPDMKATSSFIKKVILFVLFIEVIGAFLLTFRFSSDFSFDEALWYGIFHSISAFNNAGFSLFTDSLMGYKSDFIILTTLMILIVLGGIGYFVLIEIGSKTKKFNNFSVHTKIMIYGTLFLILFGFVLFLSIEWNNPKTFGNFTEYEKILNGLFLSVNFRTSGFNSIDFAGLKDSSLFFSTFFMMIGAGIGGTAGGIKITTFAILLVAVVYTLRQDNQEPNVFKRTIEQKLINKAIAIIVSASLLVLIATLILVETQNLPFMKILFEVVSAFATVGVSTGNGGILSFSAQFDSFGKGVIILLMLAGRIGVFAFGFILVGKAKTKYIKYPKGRILI
jgi:trk system potassium uptake protein TrkH